MATRRQIARARRTRVSQEGLDIGAVLGGSLRALWSNAGAFLALGLIAYMPLIPFVVWNLRRNPYEGLDPQVAAVVQGLLAVLCQWTLAAFVVRGTYEHVRGRRIHLAAMLSHGVSRLLPALGVALLVALMMIGIALGVLVPVGCLGGAVGGAAGGLLTFIAAAGLIVVLLMIACRLWVAVPAVVVERVGVTEALRRSSRLTDGTRWRVFAVLFVVQVCTVALTAPITKVASAGGSNAVTVMELATSLVFGTWSAVAAVVGYYELRRAREGLDLEDLAAVFE